MSPIISITVWITLNLLGNQCSRVEINLQEKSELGSKLKLICGSRMRKSLLKTSWNILWEGFQFGPTDQKNAASNSRHIAIPDMKLNSNRLKCLLKALKSEKGINDFNEEFRQQRDLADVTFKVPGIKSLTENLSRKKRELAGTIQTETGNCPPGHRIDQDRCFPCFPGSYTSGQETECFLCPKDFYVNKEGADACWPCPDGRKTLKEGADSEDACIDPVNNFHKKTQFSAIWIVLIILLLMFLFFSWIVTIFLLIRLCFYKTSSGSIERKVEETVTGSRKIGQTAPKSLEQCHESEQFEGSYRHLHRKGLPFPRRLLKFDVDIKGSATFTDKNSSSIEDFNTTECDHASNIKNEKNTELQETSAKSDSNKSNASHFSDDVDLNYSKNSSIESIMTSATNQEDTAEKDLTESVWKENDYHPILYVDSQLTNAGEKAIHSSSISVKQSSSAAEFGVGNNNKASLEAVKNLELSGITLEDYGPSSSKNVTEREVRQLNQLPPIEIEAEYSMKQKSNFRTFQKQQADEQNLLNFSLNQDLFSKSDVDSTGLQLSKSKVLSSLTKNGDCCITVDPYQEKMNKLPHSQPSNSNLHRNSVMCRKMNLTKPTSCPMHLDSESHVEIVLIHLPS